MRLFKHVGSGLRGLALWVDRASWSDSFTVGPQPAIVPGCGLRRFPP